MALTYGPNLGLLVNGAQGEGHYTDFMKFLRGVDFFGMPAVKGYLTNTPPGSPADGDAYVIGAAPTGAWAAQASKVARYSTTASAWEFFTPKNGWEVQNAGTARETYRYVNGAWEIFYQEGTWTPGLSFGGASVGMTFSSRSGRYTKVGRAYYLSGNMQLSAKGSSSGMARVEGFPATTATYATLNISEYSNFISSFVPVIGTASGATYGNIRKLGGTFTTDTYETDYNNNIILRFSGWIEV